MHEGKPTYQISMRADQETHDLLARLRRETGKSKAQIIREALELYAARAEGRQEESK